MNQSHQRRIATATAMKSLVLVAQRAPTEVYFGEEASVIIQATKPVTIQTDQEARANVNPGSPMRVRCRWIRVIGRGGAVILKHDSSAAHVEEL